LHKSVVFQNVPIRKRPISAKIRNPYCQAAGHKGTKKQWRSVPRLTGLRNSPSLVHRDYTILQMFIGSTILCKENLHNNVDSIL